MLCGGKKIKSKINISRFAREHNLNDLPAGCETLSKTKGCVRVSSCVCCKVGGKKHTNNSCENMVSGVRNWFTNSPMHFQFRAFLKQEHRSNITTLLVFFGKDSVYRGIIRSNIIFVAMSNKSWHHILVVCGFYRTNYIILLQINVSE